MAHHKRRRPKSSRAGCLLCKMHKHQRLPRIPRSKRAQIEVKDSLDPALWGWDYVYGNVPDYAL
jgi:hypothetical protein